MIQQFFSTRRVAQHVKVAALTAALVYATGLNSAESVSLQGLDPNEGVRESGARLMSLPMGLNALEELTESTDTILVGVHGYGSRGYEWVYPLQTIDNESTSTFFFRWDFTQCPENSADAFVEGLETILKEHPNVSRIITVGHSYGGVFITSLVNEWPFDVASDFHAVAAPLAGMSRLTGSCEQFLPTKILSHIRLFQWRTQHELDGAFQDLEIDPQVVDIEGSLAVTLPDTYRDRRLGHNWSISWVAEKIAAEKR